MTDKFYVDYLNDHMHTLTSTKLTNTVIYISKVFQEHTGMELTKNNALLNVKHSKPMIRHIAKSYLRYNWKKSKNR
jgi:hypothetical protein